MGMQLQANPLAMQQQTSLSMFGPTPGSAMSMHGGLGSAADPRLMNPPTAPMMPHQMGFQPHQPY
jgi:hypothetical protein